MLKIHKPFSKHKLLLIPITSIYIISGLLGLYYLTYTPELSHAESVTYPEKETRTMDDITYMQEITPEVCQNSELNKQYTLIDKRDGNSYSIARIQNDTDSNTNCWMTQNLRIIGPRILTPEDSNVVENYDLPASVVFSSNDNPKHFTSGDIFVSKLYYEENPTYGAYYDWFAATAGTGDASNPKPTSDICPKNWRLPTGGNTGDFYALLKNKTASTVTNAPYNFTLNGRAAESNVSTGYSGYYWSSTISGGVEVYSMVFIPSANIFHNSSYPSARYYGLGIRCLTPSGQRQIEDNVNITITPTISLDITNEVEVKKSDTNPSTAAFSALVASNQPYSVSISSSSPNLSSSTSSTTIPSKSGTLTSNDNAWGIKLSTASTYEQITTTPKLFYSSTTPESKTIPFIIGISTTPDIPNGEYATDITITATQN